VSGAFVKSRYAALARLEGDCEREYLTPGDPTMVSFGFIEANSAARGMRQAST
jgi:hypothetical protein